MLDLNDFEIWVDEDGDVWASSPQENWDASNFIWDPESGQLVFDDTPVKTFKLGDDGYFYLVGGNDNV